MENLNVAIHIVDKYITNSELEVVGVKGILKSIVPRRVIRDYVVNEFNIIVSISASFKSDDIFRDDLKLDTRYKCTLVATNLSDNTVCSLNSFELFITEDDLTHGRLYDNIYYCTVRNFNAPNLGEYELAMHIENIDGQMYQHSVHGYKPFTLGSYI